MYCPISHPQDAPDSVDQEHWNDYDRGNLPMRSNLEFREDAAHIEDTGHKEASDLTGITGLAILAKLPSIDFPRSFPPDSMHLFFENVIPALTRHYRGVFFKTIHRGRTASGDDQAQPEGSNTRGVRKRKRPGVSSAPRTERGSRKNVRGDQRAAPSSDQLLQTTKLKFKRTADAWNVDPKAWEQIGHDQKVLRINNSNPHTS